jgi:hypothetical protein
MKPSNEKTKGIDLFGDDGAVTETQTLSREQLFRIVGEYMQTDAEFQQFRREAAGHRVGSTVHSLGLGVWNTVRGLFGARFRRAA